MLHCNNWDITDAPNCRHL